MRLFREQPQILQRWRERFRYILVDEFQDTNPFSTELVRLLGEGHRNLCVVGDDDQSIYRWRGAEIGNILGFERDFPGCVTIRLEQNYRSTQTILEAAGEVVAQKPRPQGQDPVDRRTPPGEPLTLEALPDDLEEARFVAGEIVRLRRRGAAPARRRGLLPDQRPVPGPGRGAAAGADPLRHVRRGQVLRPHGGQGRAGLPAAAGQLRPIPFGASRIINVPPRGIGPATVERIAELEEEAGGFFPACQWPWSAACSGGRRGSRVAGFVALIDSLPGACCAQSYPQLTAELIEETGYGPPLREEEGAVTEEERQRPGAPGEPRAAPGRDGGAPRQRGDPARTTWSRWR